MNWNNPSWFLIFVFSVLALVFAVLARTVTTVSSPQPVITEQMSEVRAAQRDCLQHSGAVFSVKTIWAGDPPVPIEYEITCQQEQAE